MKGFNAFIVCLIHVVMIFLLNITTNCFAYNCSVLESAWDERTRLHNQYWENMKILDWNAAEEIQLLIENIDQIYCNYIEDAFFKDSFKYCQTNDPMVKLINNFSMATKKIITYDKLSKNMLREKSGIDVVWSIDEIVGRDPEFQETWMEKYKDSPAFYLISALINSLSTDSENTIKYLVSLYQHSEGIYGEYLVQEIYDLFKNNPRIVLYFTPQFKVVEKQLKSNFREYFNKQQRQVLIGIYKQFKSNANAKQILKWLGEK
jgi:hypothetical protein